MPQDIIPFTQQASGLDELTGATRLAMNVVVQGEAVRKRPGLAFLGTGDASDADDEKPVLGLFVTTAGSVYGVQERAPLRHLFLVGTNGELQSLSTGIAGDLRGTERPTFAETEALLVVAGGREPQKVILSTNRSSRLAGDPPMSTHVAASYSRLVLNDASGDVRAQFWYSDVALGTSYTGHETWNSGDADVKQVTGSPDALVALAENSSELFLWGTNSLQTWAPDTDQVYTTVSTVTYGCSAPYSIVRSDENFAWLDQRRRIVMGDGRNVVVLSDPIQNVLDGMDSVSGAYGYRVVDGWLDALVWSFDDGRTFAFQKGGGWAQWGEGTNGLTPFRVTAHARSWQRNYIGTSDGVVGTISVRNTTDFGDPVQAEVVTGFLDRGTTRTKQCRSVRLVLRRGDTTTEEPYGFLSWRDDLGPWEPPVQVSFGQSGDSSIVVVLRCLGYPYRRRQWRFTFGGSEELVLASALEEFEVLED